MPLIEVEGLVKDFTRPVRKTGAFAATRSLFTRQKVTKRAVDNVSFTVDEGEIVGYLGPNGAGKSTTIKMLTGVLTPTSGTATVNGVIPWQNRKSNARNIGVVFGQRSQLWFDLPLRDSFELIAKLYGVDDAAYRRKLQEFTELLDLDEFIDNPVRSLSLGQRMRGDLVAAMLYEPPLLYLDEPTVGLDVVAKARIRDFIEQVNAESGTTVMLTTHDLSDVERLCKRIMIIDHGTVLYDGDIAQLRRRYVPYRDLIITLADADRADVAALGELRVPGTSLVANRGAAAGHNADGQDAHGESAHGDSTDAHGDAHGIVTLRFDPYEVSTPQVIAAVSAQREIAELSVREPDLEGVIAEIYGARSVRAES